MYLWGVVSGGLFVLAAMVEQFLFGFDRSEFLVLRNEERWFEGPVNIRPSQVFIDSLRVAYFSGWAFVHFPLP